MRSLRVSLLCSMMFFVSYLMADTIDQIHEINVDDVRSIREWLNTKRQVTVKEKGGALSISGEVHTEFQTTNEKKCGIKQRAPNGATDKAAKTFDIEAVLAMDYRTERTWAAIRWRFDNRAGIFGGTKDGISLDRAFMGARLIEEANYTTDIELGRRRLNNMFDSRIEFNSLFDGIYLSYDAGFEHVGNFYTHVGAFIVDQREHHYAYVGEIGLFNIAGSGFYSKYSLIDWDTHSYPCRLIIPEEDGPVFFSNPNLRFDFIISQLLVGYRFVPEKLGRVVILYAAGLLNHKAKELELTNNRRLNWGAYAGFSIGELKKKDDWSFDMNYQLVAPQAVPDFDSSGIGLGNAANTGFYTVKFDGTGGPTTRANATGNVNFRGYQITLQYLLTNNITLFQSWQDARTLYRSIGPSRSFKQYEIEFIYGF
jgi:hypothetical protein